MTDKTKTAGHGRRNALLFFAALMVIAAAIVIVSLLSSDSSGERYADVYVPPLSVIEGGGVTAERELTLRLSDGAGNAWPDVYSHLTDEWTLTNASAQDAAITVAYPLIHAYSGEADGFAAALDGEPIEPEARVGCLYYDYRMDLALDEAEAKLRGEEYLDNVLAGAPALDAEVTVLRVSNASAGGHGELAVRLDCAEAEHRMYTCGAQWAERGATQTAAFKCSDSESGGYIVLEGRYTGEYELHAADSAGETDRRISESEPASADVLRYTTTVGELLRAIIEEEYASNISADDTFLDAAYRAACFCFAKWSAEGVPENQLYSGESYARVPLRELDAVLDAARSAPNSGVSYRLSTLTIPAGGSVTLTYSYDMAAVSRFLFLGPGGRGVPCTGFTLSVEQGNDEIKVRGNNMGLKSAGGTVTLSPERDNYYLKIR